MDLGLTLVIAIIMAFVVWLVVHFNEGLGKAIGFLMVLPILVPLIVLTIWGLISIQTAPSENISQAADTAITGILKFFESHIVAIVIGDIAGIIVGAFASLFTSK